MEKCVSDINDDKNEKITRKKRLNAQMKLFPDEMEEGINYRNKNENENYDEEKNEGETTYSDSTTN